jgi:hypothetical protein
MNPQYPLNRRVVGPQTTGLDDAEKRKFLTIPEFELRPPPGRLARSQSLFSYVVWSKCVEWTRIKKEERGGVRPEEIILTLEFIVTLGAFKNKYCKRWPINVAMCACPSVRTHVTTIEPWSGLSLNLMVVYFIKICRYSSSGCNHTKIAHNLHEEPSVFLRASGALSER